MLIPLVVLILLFEAYPIYKIIEFSLFSQNTLSASRTFVGITNFIDLFRSRESLNALKNSLYWTVGTVSLQVTIGLFVALLIHKRFPGRSIVRSLVLFSYIIPIVVAAVVWKFMLGGDTGIVNHILKNMLHIPVSGAWFSDPRTVMLAVILVEVWKNFPFAVIVCLAQLQSIDQELYQAAKVDGANRIQEFFYITLPFMRTVLIMALMFRTIWEFKYFDLIFILTQGGPLRLTTTIPVQIYKFTFEQLSLGRGSALAVVMFVVIFLTSFVYIRFYKKMQEELGA